MSEKCEFCGRFGAHKTKIESTHPQAINGLETAYLCNRCLNRAELDRQLHQAQRELDQLSCFQFPDRTVDLSRAHLNGRIAILKGALSKC